MNEGTVYKAIECLTIHVPAEYLHSTTSGVSERRNTNDASMQQSVHSREPLLDLHHHS